jgi:hypothetical protein
MTDIDELFADEVEVPPSVASNPRLLQVIGSLVVVGLIIGAIAVVIVSGISSIAAGGGNAVCGTSRSCSDLSLDEVRTLTAIDLPAGSEILESAYTETDQFSTLTATVLLPDGEDDPFVGTGYGPISAPSIEWPIGDLHVVEFYGATGEQGAVEAEGVFTINDRIRGVVLVQITRTLD